MPVTWNEALGQLQDKLRTALSTAFGDQAPRLRWTRPEGIHLTLKFLGAVTRLQSAAIDRGLRESCEEMSGFTLALGKLGTFEDRRGPRVIWVDVDGEQQPLMALARSVDYGLVSAGFPREKRPFQPHLTLARVPEDAAPAVRNRLAELAATVRTPRPGPHHFGAVSLMRSHLERGGARYERVRSYRLR
jgi:2'-5' RNA ligase